MSCIPQSTPDPVVTVAKIVSIKIEPDTVTLKVGATIILVGEAITEQGFFADITWTSSQPEIGSINQNGILLGNKPGVVVITGTALNSLKSAKATITVVEDFEPITEVLILPQTSKVIVGSRVSLVAHGVYSSVIWTSSNDTVATVDAGGVVVGKTKGVVTITAIAMVDTTKFSIATITVGDVPEIESIVIQPSSITIEQDSIIVLHVTLLGKGNASKAVTWLSTDTSVATVDQDGVVRAKKMNGTVSIIAQSTFDLSKIIHSEVIVFSEPLIKTLMIDGFVFNVVKDSTFALMVTLDVQGGASKELLWVSADTSVVVVDSIGVIFAVETGITTVSVSSVFDSTKVSQTTIVVASP